MKRKFFAIVFLSAISILAQPKIDLSEKNYDFGNIKQGEVVSHDFVVKNIGTEELVIDKVRASCGCTAAAPKIKEIDPGDSTTITVSFDSEGRTGVQKKYVYVFSNDPDHKQIRFSFTTKILTPGELDAKKIEQPRIAVSKREIDFGRIAQGEVKNAQLNIVNKGEADLVITNIQSSCDCAVASLSSKKLSPNEIAFLDIRFDSTGRIGNVTRTVTLHTNDPKRKEQTIIFYADVMEGEES